MPFPDTLYGPLGALAVLATVLVMLVRGDLVPGFIYRDERSQRARAEEQAEKNSDALVQLAAAVKPNDRGRS